ncbi:MAG: hypothetical protein N3B10_04700 [Armatimonadetes bacterium]|nr:hypothetical protein [Armatimonadota bacterium]MCX7967775.1 hypothetical protein [Armatimonadota bacterium]MDW8141997.1 hypothetical protein [Armatimonadota bacterium]
MLRHQIPSWLAVLVILIVVVVVAAVYFATGRIGHRQGAPTPPEAMKKLYLQKQLGQQPGFHMPGYAPPPEEAEKMLKER